MSSIVLRTKLHIPIIRTDIVSRERLITCLNAGVGRKLSFITAPAGFGKTTLVVDWVGQVGRPVAWISLDGSDNEPTRFFTYCIAALETLSAGIGGEAMSLLRSSQPIEAVLSLLINEMVTFSEKIILVFDDYHLISHPDIHTSMAFLLDHLPPQMHLVIISRSEPPLPLARLRAQGQLSEFGAADLRFTSGETAVFLKERIKVGLTEADLADFRAGLRYIWGWSGLRMIIIYSAIFNFIANPAISLLPLLTVNHFGGEALQLSWLQAALGIGTVSGGMVLGIGNGFQRRRIHAALTSAAGADLGLFLIGIAPATALWLALSGIFFLGFMNALVNGISTALLQARIASDLQGRVFSVLLSGSQILTLVGLAVVGPITDLVGIRTWFIIGSLAAVLLTVTMFFVPAVMQLEDKGSGQS